MLTTSLSSPTPVHQHSLRTSSDITFKLAFDLTFLNTNFATLRSAIHSRRTCAAYNGLITIALSKCGATSADEHCAAEVAATSRIGVTRTVGFSVGGIDTFRQQTRTGATVRTFLNGARIRFTVKANVEFRFANASNAIVTANTAFCHRLLHQKCCCRNDE